jgi:hypothetical protein
MFPFSIFLILVGITSISSAAQKYTVSSSITMSPGVSPTVATMPVAPLMTPHENNQRLEKSLAFCHVALPAYARPVCIENTLTRHVLTAPVTLGTVAPVQTNPYVAARMFNEWNKR